MNKNLIYVVVGVLALVGVWYFVLNKPAQNAPQPTVPEVTTAPTAVSEVVVNLTKQKDSTESGTATLSEVGGKVKVTLKLTGAPAGVTQPAHIHVGKCPEVGAVKYPLTSLVDGMSETMLDVTLAQLKSELPLGINVHKSGAESKVYVSCGDLNL